jgi:hypothetical protein
MNPINADQLIIAKNATLFIISGASVIAGLCANIQNRG